MKYGHLESIQVRLRLLSPLFIGSGESLSKKEYIFNGDQGVIHIPNLPLLIRYLKKRSLLPQYENFLINPRQKDLRSFLNSHNVREKDYPSFVSYSIKTGEAARSANFRNLLTFIKGPDGRPFIPGSNIKGALRTALASKILQDGHGERMISNIDHEAGYFRNSHKYLAKENQQLEKKAFYKLGIKNSHHNFS